jgi:hypothetical protein
MTIVQTGHEVEVRFDRPGVYQLICDIDDHLARGQRSSFTVNQQGCSSSTRSAQNGGGGK